MSNQQTTFDRLFSSIAILETSIKEFTKLNDVGLKVGEIAGFQCISCKILYIGSGVGKRPVQVTLDSEGIMIMYTANNAGIASNRELTVFCNATARSLIGSGIGSDSNWVKVVQVLDPWSVV